MYYPLLRARQFELITLRELSKEGKLKSLITPILEPVKKEFNNLNLAYNVFISNKDDAFIIVNPSVGEILGDGNHFLDYVSTLDMSIFRVAFHYNNNSAYIGKSITNYKLNNCMLICRQDISDTDTDFRALVNLPEINCINVEDPGRKRTLDRFLKGLGKKYIRLDDLFEKQARNSDFLGIASHKFSEEHLFYLSDKYNGFSDFTVLPSEYTDGGSTPRAVVIHLTYLNETQEIWIRHFTSDTNDSIANIQGKFAEAATKAVTYCRANHLSNSAIEELASFLTDSHYPGLGTVKKISIKNHLLIVGQYLSTKPTE
jgi:hypothetical protein